MVTATRGQPSRACSVPGCLKLRMYKDYCSAHKRQVERYGRTVRAETKTNATTAEAKLEKFSTPEPNTGCWLWLGDYNSVGRPRLNEGVGRRRLVTRAVLGLTDPRQQANHTCNNGWCVNPSHLYVGTQSQNIQDMIRAGRAAWQTK
jgi:hypothetical protein